MFSLELRRFLLVETILRLCSAEVSYVLSLKLSFYHSLKLWRGLVCHTTQLLSLTICVHTCMQCLSKITRRCCFHIIHAQVFFQKRMQQSFSNICKVCLVKTTSWVFSKLRRCLSSRNYVGVIVIGTILALDSLEACSWCCQILAGSLSFWVCSSVRLTVLSCFNETCGVGQKFVYAMQSFCFRQNYGGYFSAKRKFGSSRSICFLIWKLCGSCLAKIHRNWFLLGLWGGFARWN